VLRIAVITDLDQRSRVEGASKPMWRATLKLGELLKDSSGRFSVKWTQDHEVRTGHGEAGRGMELSELVMFQNRLYSMDDRTGIVFEIMDWANPSAAAVAYPRHILMEGDGNTDKGFKCEWATVKDNEMYVGSFGKEYTGANGEIVNTNNLWVKVIDHDMRIRHEDWTERYTVLRRELGYEHPAYLLHETCLWDKWSRKWVFLPRRASKDPYDDKSDETKGTNLMIEASENFDSVSHSTVGVRLRASVCVCSGVDTLVAGRRSSPPSEGSARPSSSQAPRGSSSWPSRVQKTQRRGLRPPLSRCSLATAPS
jgi:soluble calcium-activated nucleotidase 1